MTIIKARSGCGRVRNYLEIRIIILIFFLIVSITRAWPHHLLQLKSDEVVEAGLPVDVSDVTVNVAAVVEVVSDPHHLSQSNDTGLFVVVVVVVDSDLFVEVVVDVGKPYVSRCGSFLPKLIKTCRRF